MADMAAMAENIDPNAPPVESAFKKAVQRKRQLQVYAKFLERGRIFDSKKHQHFLDNQGGSAKLVQGMGQISKELYDDIEKQRKFDRYCRPVSTKQNARTSMLNSLKNSLMGASAAKSIGMSLEDREAALEKAARESSNYLTTDMKARVRKPPVFGPVGSSNASYAVVYKSDGNEALYNYDGSWDKGKPDGWGKYRFADGCEFDGYWVDGAQNGPGKAIYPNKAKYDGEWKDGHFHGHGELKYASGAVYKGYWKNGKRYGVGEMTWPNGTIYRGEWKFGKQYGFGEMHSKSSGIVFKGMWRRGFINGMGTLYLSENDYIARDWTRSHGRTFKELIEDAMQDKAQEAADRIEAHDNVFGEATDNIIKGYILNAKKEVYGERKQARDDKAEEARRYKAQMREKRRQAQMANLKLMQGDS